MSRHRAKKEVGGRELVKDLEEKGILIKSRSMKGIAEEAPAAYKDVNGVVEVVEKAGLAEKVAELSPLAVIKGE
jgi:tRNA-splicing ligase RtcB (3'-phosphate/5'-hydroxy nucleic acid ligase)